MAEALKRKDGWAVLIIAATLATVAYQAAPVVMGALEPTGTEIAQVEVIPSPGDREELTLSVRLSVYVSDGCTRLTHFALVNAASRTVYPVGQILSGKGFSTPWPGFYTVKLSVPPAIAAGRHALAVRAVYSCSWGPFSWAVTTQAPVEPVVVP